MCHPVIWIKRKFDDDDDDAYMTDHDLNHDYNRHYQMMDNVSVREQQLQN